MSDDRLFTFGEAGCDFALPLGQMADSLKDFFAGLHISAFDFRQMRLIVPSESFVWMPSHLYDPALDRKYLGMVSRPSPGLGVYHIFAPGYDSYMVFTAPTSVVTAFKLALPGIDVHSQHSVLANDLLRERSRQHPVVVMNARDGVGDFEALFNGQLLLSNTYSATDENDLLYHALGIMKRLRIETPDMELLLCGSVDRTHFDLLRRYFPNVALHTGRNYAFASSQFDSFHTYKHALLLS